MSNTNSTYRILGTVWATPSNHVGYAIINTEEKLPQVRLVTTAQALGFAQSEGFENADIENGVITITECSINRLPKYDTRGNVFENEGYMIVARITNDKGQTRGFKIVSHKGEVLHVEYSTLVGQAEASVISLINAKLRPNTSDTNGGLAILSAIRGEFKEIVIQAKEPAKEPPVNAFATSDVGTSRTNTPEYHEKFLNKVISRVATNYLVVGRKAFAKKKDLQSKRFKIYLNEFIRVKYPEFESLMKQNLHWGYTIPAILEYMKNDNIGHETQGRIWRRDIQISRPINLIRDLGAYHATRNKLTVEERYETSGLGVVPEAVFAFLDQYATKHGNDGIADVVGMLNAVNRVYSGELYQVDTVNKRVIEPNLTEGVQHPTIIAHIGKLRNAYAEAEKGKLTKDISKRRYVTSELDYTSVGGVEALGITLEKNRAGLRVPSPIYSTIRQSNHRPNVKNGGAILRYAFEGINLDVDKEAELLNIVNCYGDLKIFSELAYLEGYANTYRALEETGEHTSSLFGRGFARLVNFYTYVLAVHNPAFANEAISLLGISDILEFNIDEVDQPTNLSDKLYYNSGLRFSTKEELVVGASWNGTKSNLVPKNTFAGYAAVIKTSTPKLDSKITPRISNSLPSKYHRY